MKTKSLVICLCAVFLSSCRPNSSFPKDSAQIKVFQSDLRLFSAPGTTGWALRTLKPGEILQDLNEVSPFLTPLQFKGQTYLEPWLKVRSKRQEEGWVYGAVLYNRQGQAAPQVLHKRLAALFGSTLAHKIQEHQVQFRAAKTEAELAGVYHRFRAIQDSLSLHTSFALAVDPTYTLPDLFWLPEALPGVVPQVNAPRNAYYFFAHFGHFRQKAARTQGKADDTFFDWCIQQFPADSIEYLYPRYVIETEEGRGYSLLGRGLHLQALQGLEALYGQKTPFESDLIAAKNRCIEDITASPAAFWERTDKIIAELTQICNLNLVILTKADNIALETRLQQLQEPEKYGLRTDMQSGRL
jgi:hypothetical protein